MIQRVYVAGAYSDKDVLAILDHMRRGIRLGTKVLLAGFAPFVPWLDHHFQLMLQNDEELTVEHYYNYSMKWLEVSDAVLVVDHISAGYSKGTQAEIKRARELNIPVFYTLEALQDYNGEQSDKND